jgi:hypothetical protein
MTPFDHSAQATSEAVLGFEYDAGLTGEDRVQQRT